MDDTKGILSQAHLYIKLAIAELKTQPKSRVNSVAIECLIAAEECHLEDIRNKKREAQIEANKDKTPVTGS